VTVRVALVLALVLTVVLVTPLAAEAHQKVWRIGFLSPITAAMAAPGVEALRQGLREFGYVEGKNVAHITWSVSRVEDGESEFAGVRLLCHTFHLSPPMVRSGNEIA
jgi:hypothetical protein